MSKPIKIHLFPKEARRDMPYQDRVSVCGKADMRIYRESYITRSIEEILSFPPEQRCQQCINTRYAKARGLKIKYDKDE